jgi:D,D-heptose 1,7-bisphosphate phosphatase
MQLVIVAGGLGTRLRSRLGELPKALAPVGGKPLIERQIGLAREHGFDDIVLLLGHGREAIQECVGDGSRFSVQLRAIDDCQPRGTAGAILAALPHLDSSFLVMYGDTMLNVDLTRFRHAHAERGGAISLFLHPNDHPEDSDLVETDQRDRVIRFHPYPHDPGRDYPNQVNAGLYMVQRETMAGIPRRHGILDLAKNLLPELHARGCEIFGYRSPEYIKDIGTPERLYAVNADWESSRIARASLAHAAPAIFLDRDGTINREVEHLKAPHEFELLEGVAASIRAWNRAGWRVVVVSNQPVIARGDCTEAGMREIHNRMETALGRTGAYLDRIYYCPHHPDGGFPGERPELKIRCDCRKPGTAMIRQAQRELNLDLPRSWLIGDRTTDIRAARSAGVRSILVQTGQGGRDRLYPDAPDLIARDLPQAMRMTLQDEEGACG